MLSWETLISKVRKSSVVGLFHRGTYESTVSITFVPDPEHKWDGSSLR